MAAGVIRTLSDFQQCAFYRHTSFHRSPADGEEEEMQDADEEGVEDEESDQEEREEWWQSDSAPSPTDSAHIHTNPAHSLLRFAELISTDIQHYFGRRSREDDPDACDIYEERVFVGRSGRERYYDDLLQEAQTPSPPAMGTSSLGPLAELFDFGLLQREAERPCRPMCKRKLPPSFWREPAMVHPSGVLTANRTPDFSDLLESWSTESCPLAKDSTHTHQCHTSKEGEWS